MLFEVFKKTEKCESGLHHESAYLLYLYIIIDYLIINKFIFESSSRNCFLSSIYLLDLINIIFII